MLIFITPSIQEYGRGLPASTAVHGYLHGAYTYPVRFRYFGAQILHFDPTGT